MKLYIEEVAAEEVVVVAFALSFVAAAMVAVVEAAEVQACLRVAFEGLDSEMTQKNNAKGQLLVRIK